ncbi:hypothetical protein FBEOM_13046 [Fusarium beomiforme]|uniref:Uncharacterized protein n=1 Tax=Fusarium beomiforme TaxID=44412 RepID=A0A9P5DNK0_9HYPO|nr:hypothetical protein FBEOM_13046 [Fusarium beomiforme]
MYLELTSPAEVSRTSPAQQREDNYLPLTALAETPIASSRSHGEMGAKVLALESEVAQLKKNIAEEIAAKEHIQTSLDEANRNWRSAELEASAKDVELGRVRERLESVNDRKDAELGRVRGRLAALNDRKEAELARASVREAVLQAAVNTLKEQNNNLVAEIRHQYMLTTHQHVQQLMPLMEDWKLQVETKIDEKYAKNEANNNSDSPRNECRARLRDFIAGHQEMIENLKKGNEKFEKQIADLKIKPATYLSDLTIDRFKSFIHERENIVTRLEEGNEGFKQKLDEMKKAKKAKKSKAKK